MACRLLRLLLADVLVGLITADAQAANVQNVMGVLFSSTSFQGMFNLVRRQRGRASPPQRQFAQSVSAQSAAEP